MDRSRHAIRRSASSIAVLAALGLAMPGLTGAAAAAPTSHGTRTQKSGGDITFGLEAETTNYCLSTAQLALSGIQVASAVYETLTVPNDKGVAVPYLAKSVTPNADFTVWTIALRPGIQFQDGEPFDAAAVKMNMDSFRGAPGAPHVGALFPLVLKPIIKDVTVVDPMTVQVSMLHPLPSYPQYLYGNGRAGVMAPAQLNSPDCATKMIGTGPFMLKSYQQNEKTVVVKNPHYWRPGYPKADSITFVPVVDNSTRNVQLQGGQLDIMHQSGGLDIDQLRHLGGKVKLLSQQPGYREEHYYFLDETRPPFNDQSARIAFASAVNRNEVDQIRNKGILEVANSISDRATPGYLSNAGYPSFNLKKAKALVQQYKAAHGGQFNVELGTTTDPEASAEMQLVKEQVGKAGINATIDQFDQATLINKALSHSIDLLSWRNLHGGYSDHQDVDTHPWFSNGPADLVNFGGFSDPTTQALLDQGQQTSDLAKVKSIYQQFNRAMAQQVYILPMWFDTWTIAYQPNVTLTFPPLPDGHGTELFVAGRIPVQGLSKR